MSFLFYDYDYFILLIYLFILLHKFDTKYIQLTSNLTSQLSHI